MRVLIVGAGGREHALAWKAAQSPQVETVYVAPGNAGSAREAGCVNVDVGADDIEALVALARARAVDLTIVGPEAPLVAGIADAFGEAGLALFGPSAAAARLEGSKTFCKEFLARHAIPTAAHRSFTDLHAARAWVSAAGTPLVIKADGLAAGKGVVVADGTEEALAAVQDMLGEGAFGDAGRRVVVEERLDGEEASFICISDGRQVLALASSQDHKARDDGDRGPNTGGMGAYSPAPVIDAPMHARILREVIEPTVAGLAAEGAPYLGFLYAGLMIGADGVPRVLEFNCRFGDPETQPILMRLRSDLVGACAAAVRRRLDGVTLDWDRRAALGVVMAAQGYPGSYRKGEPITGLDAVSGPQIKVFHAGTREHDGRVLTSGGRVLCVCALGDGVADARAEAYRGVEKIRWPGAFYRRDIGHRALDRAGARR